MPEHLTFADIETQTDKLFVVCIVYKSSLNDRREHLDHIMAYPETLFYCEDYDADMRTRWFYEINIHQKIRKGVREEYANESDAVNRLHELFTVAASQYSFLTTDVIRHTIKILFTCHIPTESPMEVDMLWEEPCEEPN